MNKKIIIVAAFLLIPYLKGSQRHGEEVENRDQQIVQRAEDKKSIAAIYIKNHATTPDSALLDQLIESSEKKRS